MKKKKKKRKRKQITRENFIRYVMYWRIHFLYEQMKPILREENHCRKYVYKFVITYERFPPALYPRTHSSTEAVQRNNQFRWRKNLTFFVTHLHIMGYLTSGKQVLWRRTQQFSVCISQRASWTSDLLRHEICENRDPIFHIHGRGYLVDQHTILFHQRPSASKWKESQLNQTKRILAIQYNH